MVIPTLLCPSRHGSPAPNGVVDFCGFLDSRLRPIYSTSANGNSSNTGKNFKLGKLASSDGTSNTIMLAHKGMDPRDYTRGGLNMSHNTFWTGATSVGHLASEVGFSRPMTSPVRDYVDPIPDSTYSSSGCPPVSNGQQNDSQFNCRASKSSTGSPHGSMPVLFADGSIRPLQYGVPQDQYQMMIFWNDAGSPDPAWMP
jgi:hypothetical protein